MRSCAQPSSPMRTNLSHGSPTGTIPWSVNAASPFGRAAPAYRDRPRDHTRHAPADSGRTDFGTGCSIRAARFEALDRSWKARPRL